uniref:Si:dkey-4e7.3 n=1 Tax=Oncorhynchus kisutch TaxID=8019 RepID=A0A8C7KMW3_ONCKI
SNLTELERICREEWDKLPKYRVAKLVALYPRRVAAVITDKGRSLVATAPLTNLALAVRMEPSLPSQLKGLYIMGDNTECKGNTAVCAEYNFDRHHGSSLHRKACFIARIFRNTMEESYSERSQAQMVDSMGLVSCDSYAMAAAIDDAFVTVRKTHKAFVMRKVNMERFEQLMS